MSETYELVRKMYKDDKGNPLDLSPSQVKIFDAIFKKQYHRNHIMSTTQFGKTMTAGIAVLTRIVTFPEKWVIVAPKAEKARIMMRQVIQHTFDNKYCMSRLQIGEGESIERIRRERSKNRLTYKTEDGIGEVFILSAEASRVKDVEEALMGYGCIFGGNKIMTNKGLIEVGKLFDKQLTDKVFSFNHTKNKIELEKILDYQKNPIGKRKKAIIDLGDRKIECTDDHPVYVEGKGYIQARHIKRNDVVWVMD